jgi:hypothetical protein
MGILRKIFGGGGSQGSGGSRGFGDGEPAHIVSVYVQPRGCDEVVRVRINLHNDLSATDDDSGFIVNKTAMGTTCFQRVELTIQFDKNRRIVESQAAGGTVVDQTAYDAWVASRETPAS